ncbi:ricin B-like lectin [Daedaleopsis nitida]|nr:ricin B-like lectin [Daedaleopsis nitida]
MVEGGKTYTIINAKANTVMDLSGGSDGSPITGYSPNGGDNQKWYLEEANGHFHLKNTATNLYISIQGDPSNGSPVHASSNATEWEIKPDHTNPEAFRCFVAGTKFCLDLSDHGNSNPGTPVTLWAKWEGGTNQSWRFEDATAKMLSA